MSPTQHHISAFNLRLYKQLMNVRPTILVDFLKRISNFKRVIVYSDGLCYWIDPISHMGQAILQGEYEPPVSALIRQKLQLGGTFIDVGANEGYFTLLAAQLVGANGHVIAVEPQKRLINVIYKSLELNNCVNVSVVAAICNDGSTQEGQIWLSPSTYTGSSSVTNKYFLGKSQATACKTLQQIMDEEGLEIADFVKIDVEGYEPEVIKGALPLLYDKRIRYLFVDFHMDILKKRGLNVDSIAQQITSSGYQVMNQYSSAELSGYILYEAS